MMQEIHSKLTHTISADEFGIIGLRLAGLLTTSSRKLDRQRAFRRLVKLYAAAYPQSTEKLSDISAGVDSNGALNLYFHFQRLA